MAFSGSQISQRWISRLTIGCVSLTLGSLILISPSVSAKSFGDIIQSVIRVFSPKSPSRRSGGGKGPEAIISPGVWGDRDSNSIREVWHMRPVILYKSPTNLNETPDRIQVLHSKSNTLIQTFDVKNKRYATLVIDSDLKPGEKYDIRPIKGEKMRSMSGSVMFLIMPEGENRQKITEKLESLRCQEEEEDQNACIEQRIQKFIDAGLWSDALQEISSFVETEEDWNFFNVETVQKWLAAEKTAPTQK